MVQFVRVGEESVHQSPPPYPPGSMISSALLFEIVQFVRVGLELSHQRPPPSSETLSATVQFVSVGLEELPHKSPPPPKIAPFPMMVQLMMIGEL